MNQPACIAAIAAAMLFADDLAAQRMSPAPAVPPRPMPAPQAIPSTTPPVDHPALAAQPLVPRNDDDSKTRPTPPMECEGQRTATAAGPLDPVAAAALRAREFSELRVAGAELESAVETVVEGLEWHDDLLDARAKAAATGRPVLWIQSLGDIDGFA